MYVAAVAALAVLFTFLDPDSSRGTTVGVRFLFWFLHAGLGIAAAVLLSRLLARLAWVAALQPWVQLSLAGVVALVVFVPVSLGIETTLIPTDDEGRLGESAADTFFVELLEAGPIFLPTWCLLNLSPLIRSSMHSNPRLTPAADLAGRAPAGGEVPGDQDTKPDAVTQEPATRGLHEAAEAPMPTGWLDRLPPAVGRDLISISADLHYLNVVTSRGRAMVLGNLRDTAAELEACGIQVHRSHWVAVTHVRRVVRTARGWTCVLSDARVLPISRRRVESVKRRLGTGFLVEG